MTQREQIRALRGAGFWVLRDHGRHVIWTDGTSQISQSGSSHLAAPAETNFRAQLARAIRARPAPPKKEEPMKVSLAEIASSKWPARPPEAPSAPAADPEPSAPPPQIPSPPEAKPTKTYVKYDAVTRARLWRRVAELYRQGQTIAQITLRLQEEGFRTPDGSMPITTDNVYGSIQRIAAHPMWMGTLGRKIILASPAPKPAPPSPPPAPTPVAAVVVEAPKAKPRLPDAVLSILTDPELSDTQKVRMISAYAE